MPPQMVRLQLPSPVMLRSAAGEDPSADVLVAVLLSMLDYETFAATMHSIAQVEHISHRVQRVQPPGGQEDKLLFGTSESVLTPDGQVDDPAVADEVVEGEFM